jgi:pimeloyl-ACP methyl ester carboxylesterase
MLQRCRLTKERLSRRFSIAMILIRMRHNLLQMRTVLSGCQTQGSIVLSPKNATAEQIALAKAVQRPIALKSIQEPVPAPAWKSKPGWYLVAEEDRMINPKTQHFMAERMKATVKSFAVDHTPLLTATDKVVDIILEAAKATLS